MCVYTYMHTGFVEPFPQEFEQFIWTWSGGDKGEALSKGDPCQVSLGWGPLQSFTYTNWDLAGPSDLNLQP